MAILAIHTKSGHTIEAPFEAWLVGLINTLPEQMQHELFKQVSQLHGASLIPDKFLIGEDNLGTITIVEKPVIDLGGKF